MKGKRIMATLLAMALLLITVVSCGFFELDDKDIRLYCGTWSCEDKNDKRIVYKLIVTPEKVQLVRYRYAAYFRGERRNLQETIAQEPADWSIDSDGFIRYQYTKGVAKPDVYNNTFQTGRAVYSEFEWRRRYTDQGLNYDETYIMKKESKDYTLVDGNRGYEGFQTFDIEDTLGMVISDTWLRLYSNGRFEWDSVGYGWYENDTENHRVILHQQGYDYLRHFGNMVLSYDLGSIHDLNYQSCDEQFWTYWIGEHFEFRSSPSF